MAYVGNVAAFLTFLSEPVSNETSIYNYADKPDLSMNELVGQVHNFMGKPSDNLMRLPYWLGLLGGTCFDGVAAVTGRSFPVSSVRVRKFCADTSISVDMLKKSGFSPPYTLGKGMDNFLKHEFAEKNV